MTDRGRGEAPAHLTDAAIRAMLEERADRARPMEIDLATVVAAAGPRRARFDWSWGSLASRVSLAVTAIGAVLVTAILIVGPLVAPPTGSSSEPSGSRQPTQSAADGASVTASPSDQNLAPDRVLSAPAVGELARTRAAELSGFVVAVQGRLAFDGSVACPSEGICANTVLVAAGGGFHVKPVGDIGPGPWSHSGPLDGMFALRFTAAVDGGKPVMEFIGTLLAPPDGGLVWTVGAARTDKAILAGSYLAIEGWLVRSPLQPCASVNRPPGAETYGCPDDDYLTDEAYQPLRPDGSSLAPAAAIDLPAGAYQSWAPNPLTFGPDSVGVEPRHATWLFQRIQASPCGPLADCAGDPTALEWRVVARLDPITAAPAATIVPAPSGEAWTIAELSQHSPTMTSDYAVRGFLEASFATRFCAFQPAPAPGEPQYDCSRMNWLTDTRFLPWTTVGGVRTWQQPTVSILVQTGAYDAFAPDPVAIDPSMREPRLATWLVRATVGPSCENNRPVPSAGCAGPTIIAWSIVARL